MTKTAAILAAALSAFALFYSQTQPESQIEVPQGPWVAQECTKELEVECAVDIEKTVKACAKAFETGGVDIIADIKCTRDLMADKKHCWPCICAEAKKQGWHIVGC